MKNTIRLVLMSGALAAAAVPAFAQGPAPQAPAAQAAPKRPAEAAEKAAVRAGLDAERAAAEADAKRQLEHAQQELERSKREMERVEREAATGAAADSKVLMKKLQEAQEKAQDTLRHAQRELERTLYSHGTAALDQARYEKALQAFAEAAALKGTRADGALYWKAFAEFKQQALKSALESLKDIQEEFPQSRWLEHARALEFEVRHASGEPPSPAATPDEELKLLALNSLLHEHSEQALPMLEKMVSGTQSPRLKKRALFVLSQSTLPRAREILKAAAKDSSDAAVQLDAVRYLQLSGRVEDRQLLHELYGSAKDADVKGRLVDALFAAGDAKSLVDLARKETDVAMRKRIVERLSTMRAKEASDYMLEIIGK